MGRSSLEGFCASSVGLSRSKEAPRTRAKWSYQSRTQSADSSRSMPAFSRFAAASSSSLQQAERAASGLDALCTEASPAPAKRFCQSRTPSADSSRSRTAFLRFAAASSTSVAAVSLGSRCFCGCRRACCLGLILGFRCSFVDICRCSVVAIAMSLWMPKGAVSLRGYDVWGRFFRSSNAALLEFGVDFNSIAVIQIRLPPCRGSRRVVWV